MKATMKVFVLGAALLLLSARPASAQLSGGYALVDFNGCCGHGFMIDYAHPFHKIGSTGVSAVGDFSWFRFSGAETDTTYTGGVRFHFLNDTKVPIYGQATFGVDHFSLDEFPGFPKETGNDFTMAFGGGTVIKVTKTIGVKPQVDFFFLPTIDPSEWFFRFTANAVINLKK